MAIHSSLDGMVKESLQEYIEVADYCINFDKLKDSINWKDSVGCYGYPGALLLLSVVDCIESYVYGKVKKHFHILANHNFYGLSLSPIEIEEIYKYFRCKLTHNGSINKGVVLSKGKSGDQVYENGVLRLVPFLEVSKKVVSRFINDENLVEQINSAKIFEEINSGRYCGWAIVFSSQSSASSSGDKC